MAHAYVVAVRESHNQEFLQASLYGVQNYLSHFVLFFSQKKILADLKVLRKGNK
jgi:hypothetical protein